MTLSLVSLLVLLVVVESSGPRPSNEPTVESFTYGPSRVAVDDGGGVFTATLTVADPLGVDKVIFSARPEEGFWYPCPDATRFTMINGTAFEGTWEVECDLSSDTPTQDYSIMYAAYNTAGYDATKTVKSGFVATGGPAADYDAPVIDSVSCAETLAAGSMLDVYLAIKDASGVGSNSYVKVHETNGNDVPCSATDFVLDSGTATDGVYRASCLVPAETPNGEYFLEVHVYDTQNNPTEQNVDDAFEVVNGAMPDSTPPAIAITYDKNPVYLGDTLHVTASVSDTGSGVRGDVTWNAKESYSQVSICKGPMTLQSGDYTNGVWAFSCEVSHDVYAGVYEGAVYAYDNQNNQGHSYESFTVKYAA